VPVAGQPIAENRVYLPLVAVVAAMVVGIFSLLGKRTAVLGAAALLALAWTAHERNQTYQSELRLWTDTVQKQPQNARACVMLSVTQMGMGKNNAAIATLLGGLQRMPTNPELHNNVGVYLCQSGRVSEGVRYLREAVRLNPKYVSAYLSLGQVLLQSNEAAGAAEAFAAAVALEPANAEARNFLGAAFSRLGRAAEAIAQFEAALTLKPDFEQARANLNTMRGAR
jgi:Tfp pilus assembly protein PilF